MTTTTRAEQRGVPWRRPVRETPIRRHPSVPAPIATMPAVAAAVEHYAAMAAAEREALKARTDADKAVFAGQGRDRADLATWISNGRRGQQPKPKHEAAAKVDFDAATKIGEASRDALEAATDALEKTIAKERTTIVAGVSTEAGEAAERCLAHLAGFATSFERLEELRHAHRWAVGFPRRSSSRFQPTGGTIASLGIRPAAVVEALAEHIAQPLGRPNVSVEISPPEDAA